MKESDTTQAPALFEHFQIRRAMHKGDWHWAIVDIIKALTDSPRPRKYWSDLKSRMAAEGATQLSAKIGQLKMRASDGKERSTDVADMETVFRIIQSVPSPKAEPLKRWLAKTAAERIKEEADPSLAIERAIGTYRRRGKTAEWIKARIDGILKRRELTDEWKARGIVAGHEYQDLTNTIYRRTFNLAASGLRYVKGLAPKANPRESMSGIELALVNLAEAATVEITRDRNARGYVQCIEAANEGGMIAGKARVNMEKVLGRSIVSIPANNQPKLPNSSALTRRV